MDDASQFELFCRNERCTQYGKRQTEQQHTIQKFGFTAKGGQRYVCATCKRTFSEPVIDEKMPALFSRRQTAVGDIYAVLARVAGQRVSIVRVAREAGYKEDSILAWAREIAAHRSDPETMAQVDAHLRETCGLGEDELQAFWAYVDEKDRNRGHKPR